MSQSFHFIAIGGAVMHQLAIFLKQQGNSISGSDDVIFDPALSNLKAYGICPDIFGWDAEKITPDLDGVILGMHAKPDNPELLKAKSLGIPIYSFPEFIYQNAMIKKRVVIAGSHGKTSITSMVMHILMSMHMEFDYLVGSSIKGFDTMVKLSEAPIIIIEGDEYLSSPIDSRSKFLHYHPHIAVISGIAWDHVNVFPTFQGYLNTFKQFISSISPEGQLIYYDHDEELGKLVAKSPCKTTAYEALPHSYDETATLVEHDGTTYRLYIFGRHNLENAHAALLVVQQLGISLKEGLDHLQSFRGAAKRLEPVHINFDQQLFVYRDFAHAPSKLKASLNALKSRYADLLLFAAFELHTYSSLQEDFLKHYANSLQDADVKVVFIDDHALKIKNRPPISDQMVHAAFGASDILILRLAKDLKALLDQQPKKDVVFAFMSSGNFGGFNHIDWVHTNFVNT